MGGTRSRTMSIRACGLHQESRPRVDRGQQHLAALPALPPLAPKSKHGPSAGRWPLVQLKAAPSTQR